MRVLSFSMLSAACALGVPALVETSCGGDGTDEGEAEAEAEAEAEGESEAEGETECVFGGDPCDDGDVCTVGDACAGGACAGAPAPDFGPTGVIPIEHCGRSCEGLVAPFTVTADFDGPVRVIVCGEATGAVRRVGCDDCEVEQVSEECAGLTFVARAGVATCLEGTITLPGVCRETCADAEVHVTRAE